MSQAVSFLSLAGQLGVVLLAMWRFQIEDGRRLPLLLPLIFGGFIVHSLLPMHYRRTFFLLLSIAGIIIVLPFPHSIILVAMGLGLVGMCHLPIAFGARVALVLLVGTSLALVRAGWVASPMLNDLQQIILPVLGSMFMFRLAVYLYDLRHERTPATISERLSYFFLLPNVSFLLFPVVDYQTYRRTYYDGEEHAIYQKGLLWMVRGLTHLLLYRVVYQYLIIQPGEIQDLNTVVQFMVTSYLLYLRISGQFHMIVGILCLFGFNLPETHHGYYLSSGFNDFWRRINIYWKDFMMKMIYYPVFLRLRKRCGVTGAIVPATVAVFLGTWVLHSYQWFWLRNSFPIAVNDGLFWGFLGLMVIVNSFAEARGRKKLQKNLTFGAALSVSVKTVGFFALMCVLWSLWNNSSPGEWLTIVSRAARSGIGDFVKLAAILTALVVTGVFIQFAAQYRKRELPDTRWWLVRSPAVRVVTISSLLVFASLPYIRRSMGRAPQSFITSLREDRLNRRDQQIADRGYYEGLLDQPHTNSALLTLGNNVPEDWTTILQSDAVDRRTDLLEYELKASFTGTFNRAPFITNRWRMRDKEYEQLKPTGTYRIALIGASYEMGSGVKTEETYHAVLEDLLNAKQANGPYSRFEVLNFGVGGYSLIQKAMVANRLVPFDPDLVIATVYSTEEMRLVGHMFYAVKNGIPIPDPEVRDIVERAGVKLWMRDAQLIKALLKQHAYDFADWSFRKLKADCQQRGLPLIVLFLPTTTDKGDAQAEANLRRLWEGAVAAGVESVRLENVFSGYDTSEVQVNRWDSHPNVLGHQLLANKLYGLLLEREPRLFVKQDTANRTER